MIPKKVFKLLLFISLTFSYVDFLFSFLIYGDEDQYIKAIEKTWKNYPIKDISLIRKNGYQEIILMDFKDLELSCDCSHIEEFLLLYKEKCSKYKLSVGCNEYHPLNKASKLYGITIYVSYYEEDYLTFFNRIRKDKGDLGKTFCKDGYKRCGYLDIFNNTLCVKEEEDCPINNITFIFKNGTLSEIKTDNTKKYYKSINSFRIL